MTLIGYWPLNEDTGEAQDHSFNGNNGSLYGGVTQGVTGLLGENSYSFDGTDDYVQIPDYSLFSVSEVTISVWVKRDGSKSQEYIFDGRGHEYWIKEDDGTEKPRFGLRIGGSSYAVIAGTLPDNEWTHIVGVYNGQQVKLYIEGDEANSESVSGSIDKSSGNPQIGRYQGGGYNFQGDISEVRIYDRPLTKSEVQYLYNVGKRGLQTTNKKTS